MKDIEITFIIKALNEERNIAACIESCIGEAKSYASEIILVDSLSTDKTIEIAKQYPVKIVQFENQADVGCGAAPQLGYQHASGEYLYLLDGDMELCEGFLVEAMKYLRENSQVAGVAGKLVDTQYMSDEDRRRAAVYGEMSLIKNEKHLGGGGFYRKKAIDSVGYFSHSALLAREEFELGVRLLSQNWLLKRLPVNSVMHTGHREGNLQRICRLWRNGRLFANGALLKSALGKPWFSLCVKHLWYLFMPLILNALILAGLATVNYFTLISVSGSILIFIASWFAIFIMFSVRKKNMKSAANTLLTWHVGFITLLLSLFMRVGKPNLTIQGKVF
ncbi:glycosyltransferase family 2 protein [Moritella sp.]|uniref:glycosyltransferase n=1 Tax=Moritella sp. TaxID=78556 RepID=UPI001DFBF689|nr:glycosyltransferase family 2 protein [Moritella sp.]MCJ8349712.1 glycosyltransferase family 2 protein [Moritella sp.]NQZ39885.1 glycosyltransferase family 2 protein [Moritella sp.]